MLPKIDYISFIQKLRRQKLLIPIAMILLSFVLFFACSGEKGKSKTEENYLDAGAYISKLEKKLENSISKFSGIDDCSVMITAATLEENKYLENSTVSAEIEEEKDKYSRQNEYLVIKENGGDSVIIESRNVPKIRGALIVFKGRDDIEIRKNILDAAQAVLGIASNKICVVAE